MNWEVHVAVNARKNLRRFPAGDQKKILAALEDLVTNPYSGDIEKIGGEINTWRRRIGNYRVVYDINAGNRLVEVRIIKRRTSSTY